MRTEYKKMTSHGSVSIPVAMRRSLDIEARDPLMVEEKGGKIVITPYMRRCHFCGTVEDVQEFQGKGICGACSAKLMEQLGGKT